MAISNVALTNTFEEWRVTTNQLIVVTNDLRGDGLTTYRSVTANVVTANTLFFGTLNVVSLLASTFARANAANLIANLAYDKANTANVFAIAAFAKANIANITADAAFARANAANLIANLAYDKANTANVFATAAFNAANTMVMKTGNTMTGQLVMAVGTSSTSQNTGSIIVNGGLGVSGNVYISNSSYYGFANTSNVSVAKIQYNSASNSIDFVFD